MLGTIIILGFLALFNYFYSTIQLDFRDVFPEGHGLRMIITFGAIVVVLLPIALVIMLLYSASQQLYANILDASQDENKLFALVDKVHEVRQTLQNHLLIVGIILSLVPILTAGLRSIIIAVDDKYTDTMPLTIIFAYGLIFTLLLIFIYTPTHLALTECSRKLRDGLCEITSISDLEDKFKKRKILDELLQTNIGIGQNLKTGVITLAPLMTGLIFNLLGINL